MKSEKIKALFKCSLFYTIGQYIAEKSISALIFMIVFEGALWIMISAFILDQITNRMFMRCSAFVIPICFKCFFAIIEKYGELSVGFNLKDFFPINNKDIIVLRLFCKLLNPSEYFFLGVLVFFSFRLFKIKEGIICLFVSLVLYLLEYELLSFISYKYNQFESPVKELTAILICLVLFTMSPSVVHLFIINNGYQVWIYTAEICIIILLIIRVALLSTKKKKQNKIVCKKNKVKTIKMTIPNTVWILMKKDFFYLIKCKRSILIFPIVYLVIFYFIGGAELLSSLLPIYFPIEIAVSYGFNYWGHDNEMLAVILLSPVKKMYIIREKNMLYISLSMGLAVLGWAIGAATGMLTIDNVGYYFSFVLISLSIILPLCSRYSIKYFYREDGKSKYTIRFMFISIILLSTLSLLSSIIVILKVSTGYLLLVSILGMTIAIYRNCISVNHLVDKLQTSERIILTKLLQ